MATRVFATDIKTLSDNQDLATIMSDKDQVIKDTIAALAVMVDQYAKEGFGDYYIWGRKGSEVLTELRDVLKGRMKAQLRKQLAEALALAEELKSPDEKKADVAKTIADLQAKLAG